MLTAFVLFRSERARLEAVKALRTLVFLLFSAPISAPVLAQGYVDILPTEITSQYVARREQIVKALENNQASKWAGRYFIHAGETWSEGFWWAPEAGFTAFRDTCTNGPRAWINHGRVTFDDHKLYLSLDPKQETQFDLNLRDDDFTFVKWDQQRWLIPTDDLSLFAYAVNARSETVHEIGYLNVNDSDSRRRGLPTLPQEYKKLLGLPAIYAKVSSIEAKAANWYSDMIIDAGRDKLVIEGMSFWLKGHKDIQVRGVVTEVFARTSRISVRRVGQTSEFEGEVTPKVGWQFISLDPYTNF